MLPSIFPLLNTPQIRAFVGSNPARIYDFDDAVQDGIKPYITFTQVSNTRYDALAGAPVADFDVVQIDIYALEKDQCRNLAKLVSATLYEKNHCNRLILQVKEPETKLYRISIEVDAIN